MIWYSKCIYCNHNVYHLNDGMLKCSVCKKKYSPQRVNKILTLLDAFCKDESALHLAKRLKLSYVCVRGYFDKFRHICTKVCEDEYIIFRNKTCEYEEYFYLQRSKRKENKAIFDTQIFLSFDYEGHLYNILMPSLKKYKSEFLQDNLEDIYANECTKLQKDIDIIKMHKHENNIVKFWNYFEGSILHYNGVSYEYFPLYLKEIEFKYNHSNEQQYKLIKDYFFKRSS
ncbi:MAG: transposase [Arcobacter sp.]|nr:MAG: transposase [Arcobacter sp.]